jgi:hypothetical protein
VVGFEHPTPEAMGVVLRVKEFWILKKFNEFI